jgi:hypothetical protein
VPYSDIGIRKEHCGLADSGELVWRRTGSGADLGDDLHFASVCKSLIGGFHLLGTRLGGHCRMMATNIGKSNLSSHTGNSGQW